jgi:hypothetical protein
VQDVAVSPSAQDAARAACYLSFTESRHLQLSPEQIAAAEACGVTFLPATPAQVQRLAMQRKVFYASGQPILATRGDGFYETAGTLQRVIEEGLQQQQDLAAWHGSMAPEVAPARAEEPPRPAAEPAVAEPAVAETGDSLPASPVPERVEAPAPRPKRTRRRPPAATATSLWLAEATEDEAPAPEAAPEPPALPDIAPPARTTSVRPLRPGQRWVVAGAERRGRASKHWSGRQR